MQKTNVKKKKINLKSSQKASFPEGVSPMLATLVEKPFDSDEWITETKWDGYRALAEIRNGKARLYSRKGNFYNGFDEVKSALETIKAELILDGELIVSTSDGNHDFHFLRGYSKGNKGYLSYQIFDVLYLNGQDLRNHPLIQRKEILRDILPLNPRVNYSDHVIGNATRLLNLAEQHQFEGIIMKRANSVYTSGERSKDWLKIKVDNTTEAVVIGYTVPNKTRLFGSLVLGIYEDQELVYYGHAINVPEKEKDFIYSRLEPIETDRQPINKVPSDVTDRGVKWVQPVLVCEVKYNQVMASGKLRHAYYKGLRDDISPEDVKRETV